MQKEIYIIRHGQTDYNLKGIVQGRGIDAVLNATGEDQARSFYRHYSDVPFEKVFTSSLRRTRQTVRHFIDRGIRHEPIAHIDEISWGIYEGKPHDSETHERYLSIIDQWRSGDVHVRIDGGESAFDLFQRAGMFIEQLRSTSEKVILVCTHGRTMRVLLCAMTGTPLSNMDDFPHINTCLYKVLFLEDRFEIDVFNNTDHLPAHD